MRIAELRTANIPIKNRSIESTLGFVFNGDHCLLIQKNRPDWQKGRLNGIGGKLEPGEYVIPGVIREIEEETGYPSSLLCRLKWNHFTQMYFESSNARMHVLSAEWTGLDFWDYYDPDVDNGGEGTPVIVNINNLPNNCLPILHWLIPMSKRPKTAPWKMINSKDPLDIN